MPQLSPKAIAEFQTLWKKHYGTDLPREQATVRAHQVFAVLRLLIEPDPRKTPPANGTVFAPDDGMDAFDSDECQPAHSIETTDSHHL